MLAFQIGARYDIFR